MKALKLFFLGFLFATVLLSCSSDGTVDNDLVNDMLDVTEVYEENNVAYGSAERQKFDLYLPANRTANTKTIILIHGGGWTSGSKEDMDAFKELIAKELPDLAIVNMNYRLADENNSPYPMQIEDIKSVIDFLKDHKSKYSISETIGFVGTSAGGHLALLYSYAFNDAKTINMVCSIVGPTNFTDPAYLNTTNPVLEDLLEVFGVNPTTTFLEEVSPYHNVTATAPNTILFYGGQDPLIPTTQGTDLRDKLQRLNVTHQFTLYDNAGHGWTGLELLDTWSKLKVFMQAHL